MPCGLVGIAMIRSVGLRLLTVAIVGCYLVRAAYGLAAGSSFEHARELAGAGRYAEALTALNRAKLAGSLSEISWLAGDVQLGFYDVESSRAEGRADPSGRLAAATREFLEGYAMAPASGWFLDGLADVYRRRARTSRASRSVDFTALVDRGPWSQVGDDGRIEIGLIRLAVDKQPATHTFRDNLVLALERNGLHEEALAAIQSAAEVLPDFSLHGALTYDAFPQELLEAFYQASRASLGKAPLQSRERHLLSLGRLGERLGHTQDAEADYRAALLAPGPRLAHAEDSYYLAMLLIVEGRYDDAAAPLAGAEQEAVFVPSVLASRASIAENQGRLDDALSAYAEARRVAPRRVDLWIGYADVARRLGKNDQAIEALRWSIVIDPANPLPRVRLAELYLESGDRTRAAAAVSELKARAGDTPDVNRLEKALAASP